MVLTTLEAALLGYLADHAGAAVSREELLDHVWGYHSGALTRAVDHTVKRLRPKIEPDPARPQHLITVRGVGYRLEIEQEARLWEEPDTFVGRQEILAELAARFAGGARLVTLLGPGGMGKTRVAKRFSRGHARFCDLSGARDATGIAAVVGEVGAELLVLDNFEQIVEYGPETVGHWLQQEPGLQVLVTSRERLALRGESCLLLDPLPPADAAELFLDRARALRPELEASQAVTELVGRLDGLPLALELAAARAGAFSPETMLKLLADRFTLLTGGPRDAPTRQATLRDTIDWSWNLLEHDDRRALTACSLFRGGFELDAAHALLGPSATLRLQALWDRSLVVRDGSRYRLLESIAAFAEERLGVEREGLVAQHAAWYLELAESLARGARQAGAAQRLETLQRELENLTAVIERTGGDRAARVCLALDKLWSALGQGEVRVQNLLRGLEEASDPALRARLHRAHGETLAMRRSFEEAHAAFDAGAEAAPDPASLCPILRDKAGTFRYQGRTEEAWTCHQRALDLARQVGDPGLEGSVLTNIAILHQTLHRLQEAEAVLRQALECHRRAGNRRSEGIALHNLGGLCHQAKDLQQAEDLLRRALAIFEDVGDRRRRTLARSLGLVLVEQGDNEEAFQHLIEALATAREVEEPEAELECLHGLAILHLREGRLDEAKLDIAAALAISPKALTGRVLRSVLFRLDGKSRAAEAELSTLRAASPREEALIAAARGQSVQDWVLPRLLSGV